MNRPVWGGTLAIDIGEMIKWLSLQTSSSRYVWRFANACFAFHLRRNEDLTDSL